MNVAISNILTWLVLGLVAGFIIHLIDSGRVRGGLLGTLTLGLLGAVVGGFLSNALFGVSITGFNITSVLIATLGALLVSFLYRVILQQPTPARGSKRAGARPEPSYASEIRRGSTATVTTINPVIIERFLNGVDYPANREDLIEHARRHGASEEIMDTLLLLPDREYQGSTTVSRELGKLT